MGWKGRLAIMLVFTVLVMVYLILALSYVAMATPDLPTCQEDQVLVGQGRFVGGRWERYICGPALDDWGNGY